MRRNVWKTLIVILCIMVLVACLSALVFVQAVEKSENYVPFDQGRLNRACTALTILDADGQELPDAICCNNVKQIPLSALHDYTYLAFVSVEDKRFFSHKGIDVKRVMGAAVHNLQSGSFKEGASTISQQLIKNTHLNNDKKVKRKVNEMLLALELEKRYSKEEILEAYLNTIYFGRNAYGIERAANAYFNKSAKDLTVAESALLAGMIKAPNVYAPDKNAEKCKNRRDTVLKLMLEQQIIDSQRYENAVSSEIKFEPYDNLREKTYADSVIAEACKLLNMTETQLYCSDFVIETYCDSALQKHLLDLAKADKTLTKSGSLADLSCVVCGPNGGVQACYFRGETALSAKQIGSTAKPIAVYTPALCERLITQASPVLDEPTNFGGYCPTNASGYNGWTTVKFAVAKSLNVPAVKTLNSLGVATAKKYLKAFGIDSEQDLSLALGNVNGGMTAQQLLNCYNTLANGGEMQGVAYISKIYSSRGEIYARKAQKTRVFDEKSTFLMTDMLQNAVQTGTAKALSKCKVPTAAKTGTVGTAEGNSQALLAGYTTCHTYVVWYSGDLPNSVNGATSPCEFAAKLLAKVYENNPPKDFLPPKGVVKLSVDKENLNRQLVTVSESGEKFWFDEGNKPAVVTQQKTYNYVLTTAEKHGEIVVQFPEVESGQTWKLFGEDGNERENSKLTSGKYFAKLFENGKEIYVTPPLEIRIPEAQTNDRHFWDFWYLPF